MVLFSSFCVVDVGQKNEFEKFYLLTFAKGLEYMKAILEPIDLTCGIWMTTTPSFNKQFQIVKHHKTHKTYVECWVVQSFHLQISKFLMFDLKIIKKNQM